MIDESSSQGLDQVIYFIKNPYGTMIHYEK